MTAWDDTIYDKIAQASDGHPHNESETGCMLAERAKMESQKVRDFRIRVPLGTD